MFATWIVIAVAISPTLYAAFWLGLAAWALLRGGVQM